MAALLRILFFFFERGILMLFSRVNMLIKYLWTVYNGFHFSKSLPKLVILSVNIQTEMKQNHTMALILHFSDGYQYWQFFHMLIGHWLLFEGMSIQFLWHFLIRSLLLLLRFWVPDKFWISIICQMSSLLIFFSHSACWLFPLLSLIWSYLFS